MEGFGRNSVNKIFYWTNQILAGSVLQKQKTGKQTNDFKKIESVEVLTCINHKKFDEYKIRTQEKS